MQLFLITGTYSHNSLLSALQVGKLELVYSLAHQPNTVVITNESCRIMDDGFQVHHDKVDCFADLNRETSRYFSRGDSKCFRELK